MIENCESKQISSFFTYFLYGSRTKPICCQFGIMNIFMRYKILMCNIISNCMALTLMDFVFMIYSFDLIKIVIWNVKNQYAAIISHNLHWILKWNTYQSSCTISKSAIFQAQIRNKWNVWCALFVTFCTAMCTV